MMTVRPLLFAVAVSAICWSIQATPLWAAPVIDPSGLSLTTPTFAADTAAEPGDSEAAAPTEPRHGLLMQGLDRLGVGKALDRARLDIYGHVEGGYTYVYQTSANFVALRSFDVRNKQVLGNQLDLNVERTVDPLPKKWDIGGRFEVLYGADAQRIHANGETLGQNNSFGTVPLYQVDIVQFYLDLTVPVGNGLRVRAGKFLYFYSIDPNENVFYSHGFAFNGAAQISTFSIGSTAAFEVLPLTLMGVSVEYPFTDRFTAELGVATGWNQAQDDDNKSVAVFGRISADLSKNTRLTVKAITGPELANNNHDYRFGLDVVLSHRFTDNLTLIVNPVFGFQSNGIRVDFLDRRSPLGLFRDDYWYGVSATGQWVINDRFSVAARGEFFRDDGGTITFNNQWLSEVTLGATVTPLPKDPIISNLKFRPEVRFDYASERAFPGEHFSSRHEQLTSAIDAIFNF